MSSIQNIISTIQILNWLLAGGACAVLIIGLGELFVHRKKAVNYFGSALCLSFSLAILIYLIQSVGLYREWPQLLYINYPLELLAGHFFFFFFTLLMEKDFPIRSPYLLLFLPVLIATGLMMPYFLQAPALKIEQVPLYKTSNAFFHSVYLFIGHNLESWMILNMLLFLGRTALKLRSNKVKKEKKSGGILLFAGLFLGVLLFYLWVDFFPSETARKLSIFLSILLVFPVYFFQRRNPGLFGESNAEEKPERYQSSTKLAGKDTAKIIEALDSLMAEKKLYMNNELTLAELGDELSLTPHQLSEILNGRLGLSFRQYINRFRVEAAEKLLSEKPECTILDIAFGCGFGSKSTFNSVFSQATGMTPSEWRNNRAPGSPTV